MTRRRRPRPVEAFSLSFLDVVSCGFGAILLLLVISKIAEPSVVSRLTADLSGVVAALETRIDSVHETTRAAARDLAAERGRLAAARARLDGLEGDLARARDARDDAREDLEVQRIVEGSLADARQTLTEEMRRLLAERPALPRGRAAIGGVPVDSEYVVFIIDTSGSMFDNAWPLVLAKVGEVLDVYPEVEGIQVMNDMGEYMFSQYAGRWIPDTPARRRAILGRLRSWSPFSNSSPVEGITEAIRRFAAPDRRISLYVFGDEFARGSLQAVVDAVDRLNRAGPGGERRVRIHGVGFPTQFARPGAGQITGIRFAALMRALAERNGGTFVGLDDFRR